MKGLLTIVIVVAIIIVSSIIVVNSIAFVFDEAKEIQGFNEIKETMTGLDGVLRPLLFEAAGSEKSFNMNLREGTFFVDGSRDMIYIELDTDTVQPGSDIKEGNLIIQRGPFVYTTMADIGGDGVYDYILENNAVQFAIRAVGTEENHVMINMSNIITVLRNKKTEFGIVPSLSVFLDNINVSSGYGYTRITGLGGPYNNASVLVWLNTTNFIYKIFFELEGSHDFIEMDIKEIIETGVTASCGDGVCEVGEFCDYTFNDCQDSSYYECTDYECNSGTCDVTNIGIHHCEQFERCRDCGSDRCICYRDHPIYTECIDDPGIC
ncbi:hypothetical protein ACFLQN_02470 [Candidatus Aenigmatarchaeota archaeon]